MTGSSMLCVNGKRYFHRSSQKQLDLSIDLISWLATQNSFPKCYWEGKDGMEVAAVGSVLTLNSVPCFAKENTSAARFWGGHAFSPSISAKDSTWHTFPKCAFFLPQYELIRTKDVLMLITHAINTPIKQEPLLHTQALSKEHLSLKQASHLPKQEDWHQLVKDSLTKIQENLFEKVVLARRSSYTHNTSLDALEILSKIKNEKGIRFALQFSEEEAFIGSTPEQLYTRKERHLCTEAVAGTRKRGKTKKEDLELEKELKESPKEQSEFAFVKTSIQEGLQLLCTNLTSELQDGIIKTKTVQHLHNKLEATLLDGIDDGQILSALHPTAAMGGWPRNGALAHLLEKEPFERGWYSAPIGFVSNEEASFAVGIRSALVEKQTLHLFAGTGIVRGSSPEQEWEELEHKTSQWRQL